ncbi:MAG: hypothetical protein ACREJU_18130 [Nitrospiraceae bacterium]
MQITLDEEQWEVADNLSLLQVLAQVSDKAQAKQCIVTSLRVGGKSLTDRDLQPALLSRIAQELGMVQATSRAVEEIVVSAEEQLLHFGALIRRQGESLIGPLRAGTAGVNSVDGWLGLLADYVEAREMPRVPNGAQSASYVSPWIGPLLDARSAGDVVRLTDCIEYELLPRLPE